MIRIHFAPLICLVLFASAAVRGENATPVPNAGFEEAGASAEQAKGFELEGDAARAFGGRQGRETGTMAVRLYAGRDLNQDGKREGRVRSLPVALKKEAGRWYRFSFRGLPEPGFSVAGEQDLFMRVEFFAQGGAEALDGVVKELWPLVRQRRKDLDANGLEKRNGAAVWQDYSFEFKLPFPNIDALRLSIGFRNGNASEKDASFVVDDLALEAIEAPQERDRALAGAPATAKEIQLQAGSTLVHLGGHWYYERLAAETGVPRSFTAANASRLYYKSGRLEAPFAGNMTAWLRAGYLNATGEKVAQDRFLPDNVTVIFTQDELVVKAKNIPNHPTAVFPGYLGNPNSIQEKDRTYRFPLNPQPNPNAKAMDLKNKNRALNMGPIGIAANGVVFYNPFDVGMEEAVDIMDRCCGHPSPDNMYHYHKYPVCVRSPWADEGLEHSPLIGFAFDGFPIYGPYESKGVLAKDLKENALNAFNVHYDKDRGWHYHVTPGAFPYLIGGYYGKVVDANLDRRGPPGGGQNGPGGPGGPGGRRGPPPEGNHPPPEGDRPPPPHGEHGDRPPPPPPGDDR
ncbi:MAG: YHYH protein [Planctomycetota bacterium]|nr:YHYH protein [Planctomycetota bacterium]